MKEWIVDGRNRLNQARTPQERALMKGHLSLMEAELETFSATPALPEGAIRLPDLTIGGKSPGELEESLASGGFRVSDWAKDMLRSRDFTTLPNQQSISLVKVSPLNMGMTGNPTLSEIVERAKVFSLGKVPAEVAPYLRMADTDQPLGDLYFTAMEPIADSDGDPNVFELERDEDGSWLRGDWADPDDQWRPRDQFVFALRTPAGGTNK